MKNKQGFTLIELLATITVVAILAIMATTGVMSIINNQKNNLSKNAIKSVEDAAITYFNNKKLYIPACKGDIFDATEEIEYVCPTGFTKINDKDCELITGNVFAKKCPEGSTADGSGGCYKNETVSRTCPSSSEPYNEYYCVRTETVTPICPYSGNGWYYDQTTGTCKIKNTNTSLNAQCPDGYDRIGTYGIICSRKVFPNYTCPAGSTANKDVAGRVMSCSKKVTVSPLDECPNGSKKVGDKCKQVVTQSTTEKINYTCPSESKLQDKKCSGFYKSYNSETVKKITNEYFKTNRTQDYLDKVNNNENTIKKTINEKYIQVKDSNCFKFVTVGELIKSGLLEDVGEYCKKDAIVLVYSKGEAENEEGELVSVAEDDACNK